MSPRRPLNLDAIGLGLAVGFLLAVAAGAVAGLGDAQPEAPDGTPTHQIATAPPGDGRPSDPADPVRRTAVVHAVEAVAPSVVSITTEVPSADPFLLMRGRSNSSEGSGVVIADDGVVLTNAHVVQGATRIVASFASGQGYDAEILGLAPELDLAVLRLRGAAGLTPVAQGTSADLMLGEPVIAIGNPFGLGHTVTTGVISAVSRPLATDERTFQDFIQTDASINPGNSGGPLVNARGQLVGINTAIRPDAQGIGFAIPADRALKVARDLVDFGAVQIPWLGLDLSDVMVRTATGRATAPRVEAVHPETPAAEAGLRPGTVLLAIDGRPVQGRADLNAYLSGFEPERSVRIDLLADGQERTVALRTGRVPESVVQRALTQVLGVEVAADARGLRIARLSGAGAAARRGLRPGDRILAVNSAPTRTLDELQAAVAQAKSGHRGSALFTVARGDHRARMALPL